MMPSTLRSLSLPLSLSLALVACSGSDPQSSDSGVGQDADDYSDSACFGETRQWDLTGDEETFTCRAEGERVRVWLDPAWQDAVVPDQDDVASLMRALDQIGPDTAAQPDQGALAHLETYVGPLPDVVLADDGKIDLVFSQAMLLSWMVPDPGVLAVAAPFWELDELVADSVVSTHALMWGVTRPDQEAWVVATLGTAAAAAAGYPVDADVVQAWLDEPSGRWGPNAAGEVNPSATAALGTWARQALGAAGLSDAYQSDASGWDSIVNMGADAGYTDELALWRDFLAACLLLDGPVPYALELEGLVAPDPSPFKAGSSASGTLAPYGVVWFDNQVSSWVSYYDADAIDQFQVHLDLESGEVQVDPASDSYGEWRRYLVITNLSSSDKNWEIGN